MTVVHKYIHTCEQFLNLHVGLGFVLYVCLDLLFRVFVVSINYFILVLLAFVVLGLISSVLSQQIGWEEHL